MRILKIVILVISLLISSLDARAMGPMAQMRTTIEGVLHILKDEDLKRPENRARRRQMLKQLIYSRFDFEEMSRRALGIQWAKRSPGEKKEFVPLFSELLERSYISRIESYTGERVLFTGERIDDGYAVVRTRIISKGGIATPVDYRLIKKGDEWLVYDVIIEGVSLINNYRVQFNKIISSESYEGLIRRMRDKLRDERILE